MKISEIKKQVDVSDWWIRSQIHAGNLQAEKKDDGIRPYFDITTPLDEIRRLVSSTGYVVKEKPRGQKPGKPIPEKKDIFTTQEAADFIGVSPSAVNMWIRAQNIKTLQNGRNRYLRRADVERLQATHRPRPETPTTTIRPKTTDFNLTRIESQLSRIETALSKLTNDFESFVNAWK
jgi:excisionase family DNA binding protein